MDSISILDVEKIFRNHISDKVLISKIQMEPLQLNSTKNKKQKKKQKT